MKYALMYDAMGEHKIRITDDNKVELIGDPDVKPDRLDPELDSVLGSIWAICRDLEQRGRMVPPTKTELHGKFKLKKLRKLADLGFLSEKIVTMNRGDKKNVGSRSCIMFTELGRAYGKTHHDTV